MFRLVLVPALVVTAFVACSSSEDEPAALGPGKSGGTSSGSASGGRDGGTGTASSGGTSGGGSSGTTPLTSRVLCSMPDLEASTDSFGVKRVRIADDGSLYALFGSKVRRYTVDANDTTCTITLDPAFGTDGGVQADSFDLGPAGKITVKTFFGLEVRDRTTGALGYSCESESVGRVAVSPDDTTVYVLSETKPAESQKLVLGESGCTSSAAWAPSAPWATDDTGYAEAVIVSGDTIVVGAQESVLLYGLDGTRKAVFGQSKSPKDWDTFGLAYANDIAVTSAGIDVVDENSPSIHRYDMTGNFVKRWTITDLTGLPDTGTLGATPQAVGVAPTGERFLAIRGQSTPQMWRLPEL